MKEKLWNDTKDMVREKINEGNTMVETKAQKTIPAKKSNE